MHKPHFTKKKHKQKYYLDPAAAAASAVTRASPSPSLGGEAFISISLTARSSFLPSCQRLLETPSATQNLQSQSSGLTVDGRGNPVQEKWKPRSHPSQTNLSESNAEEQPQTAQGKTSTPLGISAGKPSGRLGLSWMERTREVGERMKVEDEDEGEGRVSEGDGTWLRSMTRTERLRWDEVVEEEEEGLAAMVMEVSNSVSFIPSWIGCGGGLVALFSWFGVRR